MTLDAGDLYDKLCDELCDAVWLPGAGSNARVVDIGISPGRCGLALGQEFRIVGPGPIQDGEMSIAGVTAERMLVVHYQQRGGRLVGKCKLEPVGPYLPQLGQRVRVVEVHPKDPSPNHSVGDELEVRTVFPYGELDKGFGGYVFVSAVDERSSPHLVGTICRVEPALLRKQTAPPVPTGDELERIGRAISELMGNRS